MCGPGPDFHEKWRLVTLSDALRTGIVLRAEFRGQEFRGRHM